MGKCHRNGFSPKSNRCLDEEVYNAADRFIEGGDWVVQYLCGKEVRSSCMAGYKGMWDREAGFPSPELLNRLHPRLGEIVGTKLSPEISPLGSRAGELRAEVAQELGLKAGTAVGVAIIDAHAAVPGSSVTEPGKMVMVMGTSTCHMLLAEKKNYVDGMCGCVMDGILPGYYGYEAGQPATGDIFAWFVENCVSCNIHAQAQADGVSVHQLLEQRASQLRPGQSGLLALDWWNGNRSVLVDAELSGLMLGMTLTTKAEEIYLALIEATAFGTKKIIHAFEEAGIAIRELYACGGLPQRNRLLMQVYSDVTGLPIFVAASSQPSALGAAILGAVAAGKRAGGYDSPQEAAQRMARLDEKPYSPRKDYHEMYKILFDEYVKLHDYFGRGQNPVMKTLRKLRQDSYT